MSRELLRPDVLAGLKSLDLVARAAVDGFVAGLHRSPRFGFSQEFAEYRAYVEGDDTRFIDWNVYARTDRTYIKRFIGETNTQLMIMLDVSASMGFGTGAINKLRYGKFLAASLAWLAARQHDAVGLLVFDEQVREYRPPSARAGRLGDLLHAIDRAAIGGGTDWATPFERFRRQIKRRGLVAVISDFYCDPAAVMANVQPLAHGGQDVMLFQLLDQGELEPAFREPTVLEDLESGARMEVDPDYLAGEYRQRVQAHVRALQLAAGRVNASHVFLNVSEPLDQALRNYLRFRERRA